jgi:hypothetical protein
MMGGPPMVAHVAIDLTLCLAAAAVLFILQAVGVLEG